MTLVCNFQINLHIQQQNKESNESTVNEILLNTEKLNFFIKFKSIRMLLIMSKQTHDAVKFS